MWNITKKHFYQAQSSTDVISHAYLPQFKLFANTKKLCIYSWKSASVLRYVIHMAAGKTSKGHRPKCIEYFCF